MEKVTASVAETCEALGIGKTRCFELIKSGELETIKLGQRRLVKVSSIHRLVERAAA